MPGYGMGLGNTQDAKQDTKLEQKLALKAMQIQRSEIAELQTQEIRQLVEQEMTTNIAAALDEKDKLLSEEEKQSIAADRDWIVDDVPVIDKNREDFQEQLEEAVANGTDIYGQPGEENAATDGDDGGDGDHDRDDDVQLPPERLFDDNGEQDAWIFNIPERHFDKTLEEHLKEQWLDGNYPKALDGCASKIIDKLDSLGYFSSTIPDCAQEILSDYPETDKERLLSCLQKALDIIRTFDPSGIAAYNQIDCYKLQVQRILKGDPEYYPPEEQEMFNLLFEHQEILKAALEARNSDTEPPSRLIVKKLKKMFPKRRAPDFLTEENAEDAFFAIQGFNPYPAMNFARNRDAEPVYVSTEPDVEVCVDENKNITVVSLSPTPHIYKSRSYMDIKNDPVTPADTKKELESKFARIDQLNLFFEERGSAIVHLTNLIVKKQEEYFLTGDRTKLKPMTQNEIAKEFVTREITKNGVTRKLGADDSYISRIVGHDANKGKNGKDTRKYMKTPYGTLPFEFFFNNVVKEDADGNGITRERIMEIIKDIRDNPPPDVQEKAKSNGKIPSNAITEELNKRLISMGYEAVSDRAVRKWTSGK